MQTLTLDGIISDLDSFIGKWKPEVRLLTETHGIPMGALNNYSDLAGNSIRDLESLKSLAKDLKVKTTDETMEWISKLMPITELRKKTIEVYMKLMNENEEFREAELRRYRNILSIEGYLTDKHSIEGYSKARKMGINDLFYVFESARRLGYDTQELGIDMSIFE